MSRASLVKVGLLVALVAAAVLLQVFVGLPSQAELRSALDALGPWAVPAFVVLYLAIALLPGSPAAVVTIVGGALLGFGVALPAVLLGATLGGVAAFLVSRLLGRAAVVSIENDRVRALDARVREHAFVTVLVARLVPLIPFSTANYAFGLTSVPLRPYAAATALGIAPGTAVYVAVGAYGAEPGSWPFLLAVAALVLLTLVGWLRARRASSRGGRQKAPA